MIAHIFVSEDYPVFRIYKGKDHYGEYIKVSEEKFKEWQNLQEKWEKMQDELCDIVNDN